MDLSRYDVSVATGFLPSCEPPERLAADCFGRWEEVAKILAELIRNGSLRHEVTKLPPFLTEQLQSEAERWRAYTLLTFLSHGYVWSGGEQGAARKLPAVLAEPWCELARQLDLPPVITYSAAVLYNWRLKEAEESMRVENMASRFSFTGTADEEWFYVISASCELCAARFVREIPTILQCCRPDKKTELLSSLGEVRLAILEMKQHLQRMYDRCNPSVFYQQIRVFHSGWNGNQSLPNGLIYSGVSDIPQQYSGGNAGQSPSLPVLDILLGVQHSGEALKFLMKQRDHMSKEHRLFLETWKENVLLRDYVIQSKDEELKTVFNEIVDAVVQFRTEHIKLIALYIVIQMHKNGANKVVEATGTGGTHVIKFLKSVRTATEQAKLL